MQKKKFIRLFLYQPSNRGWWNIDYFDDYYNEVMHTFPTGMFCVYSFMDSLASLEVP